MPHAAVALLMLLVLPVAASADTASRLVQLMAVPGVSGYERAVREAIEMSLPVAARVRADNMGNIVLRIGNGAPHTMILAPLDESGLVVSAITEDGYLRVHRHGAAPGPRLAAQFWIGQPIVITTANGSAVHGVTATPSTHLRGFRNAEDEARIKSLDDLWIDLGVESRAEVEKLGVRMLDPVSLRDRVTSLAGGRVSGVGAASRAAALVLAEIVRRRDPAVRPSGTVTLAWVTQAEYGHRGALRLVETLNPDRVIILRGALPPGDDALGDVGLIGKGPIVQGEQGFLDTAATRDGITTQGIPFQRLTAQLPQRLTGPGIHVATLPARFAHTPVETVDAKDVDAMAQLLARSAGLGALTDGDTAAVSGEAAAATSPPLPQPGSGDLAFQTLRVLIETHGVSAHEAPVREQLLKRMPTWAKPDVDKKGNIRVSFGPADGRPLIFIAHMDEVGFEVTKVAPDGTAAVRTRGGMYLSVYEAHPVVVQTPTGAVPAVLAPRRGYTTAKQSQPPADELFLYFGTESDAQTAALGIAPGQPATVRKQFVPLGTHRATGRAMDDRNGSTALLLALANIDPAKVTSRVTFAWAVEEETGLAGAAFIAGEMRADTVFAVDTFVSSDTPIDTQRLAGARLGRGAVLRGLDSRTLVQPHIIDRITGIARTRKIPLQIGITSGGTDASVFNERGAVDVGLSWPGRYSHSPVEVMDRRDLDALVNLIVALCVEF